MKLFRDENFKWTSLIIYNYQSQLRRTQALYHKYCSRLPNTKQLRNVLDESSCSFAAVDFYIVPSHGTAYQTKFINQKAVYITCT